MSFSKVYTSNFFLGKSYHGIILNNLPPLDLIMHSRSQVVRVEGSHKGMTGSRRLVMEKAQRVVTGSILMDQKSISTKKRIVKVKKTPDFLLICFFDHLQVDKVCVFFQQILSNFLPFADPMEGSLLL